MRERTWLTGFLLCGEVAEEHRCVETPARREPRVAEVRLECGDLKSPSSIRPWTAGGRLGEWKDRCRPVTKRRPGSRLFRESPSFRVPSLSTLAPARVCPSSRGAPRRACTRTRSSAFGRGRSTLYRSLSRGDNSNSAAACDFFRSTAANFIGQGTRTGPFEFRWTPRQLSSWNGWIFLLCGSACGPVIVPVFKTGERQAILSLVGSTPTRFRQFILNKFRRSGRADCPSLGLSLRTI